MRSQGMQRGNLFKQLNNQNEAIEIQRHHRRNHINAAPNPAHLKRVSRQQSKGQHNTRQNSKDNSRSDMLVGKGKPSHAGNNCAHKKNSRSAIKGFAFDQSKRDKKPRADSNQTDDYVELSER